jgi:hypothetical protein
MDKKLFSFKQFINEQEIDPSTGVTGATVETPSRPETEREAKSRIATSIIKNLFGDSAGLSGGVDSIIDQTKEVKESLPYKGCGASSPYPLEKNPLSVMTIKILLDYLQEKKIADYSRVITELKEKRAVIIGVRNKLDIKKDPNNQDRFVDALYFIPGNAKDGSDVKGPTGGTGGTGGTGSTGSKNTQDKKSEDKKDKSVFGRNKELRNRKNESLEDRLNSIDYIIESGVFTYEQYYSLNSERNAIIEELAEGYFGWDKDKYEKIRSALKKDNKKDSKKDNKVDNKKDQAPVQSKVEELPKPPASLGDMITPYQITTVPSLAYYGKKPMNPKGVGIKLPGDTLYLLQESTLGSGTKYKMMVEAEKIKVGRYPIGVTKFETYKPAEVYDENCGMQIHRSSTKGVGICVGPWSAGCQVFADYQEWQDFISKAEKEQMNATKFYYALIQLDDIPKEVMDSALIGLPYTGKAQPLASATGATGSKESKESKGNTNKKPKVLTNFGNIS